MEIRDVVGLPSLSRKKKLPRSAVIPDSAATGDTDTQQSREIHQSSHALTPGDLIPQNLHALHREPLPLGRDTCLPGTNHSAPGTTTQQLLQAQRDRLRATPLGQQVQSLSNNSLTSASKAFLALLQ